MHRTPINHLMWDNTTAVATLVNWGACTPPLAMRLLCLYAIGQDRNNWLSTAFIPGIENTVADFHSLNFQDNTEWMLNPVVFKQLTVISFVPEVDIFASKLNCQHTPFVSWKPEPGEWAVNTFSLCWTDLKLYAFLPFSILGRVLAKVQQDGATGMLVTPFWFTQPWFPQLLELLIDHP